MKLTNKRIEECKKLVDEFGYWSNEVKEYLNKFHYNTAIKLSNMMINYEKGV
jgi:hypothetical protein